MTKNHCKIRLMYILKNTPPKKLHLTHKSLNFLSICESLKSADRQNDLYSTKTKRLTKTKTLNYQMGGLE
jgi:hypothetical protein